MTYRRLIDRISPVWLGIGISGSLLLVLLVMETVLGRWSELLIGGEFDPLASVSEGMLRDIRIDTIPLTAGAFINPSQETSQDA